MTVCPALGRRTSRGLLRFDRVDSTHRMKQSDAAPASRASPLPTGLLVRLAGLPELFTRPTWRNALLLLTGAILAPGKPVTAALRILGREQETDFSAAATERPNVTAQGYRRFRCRDCGRQFNERSDGALTKSG
jgi:hypothetical protein